MKVPVVSLILSSTLWLAGCASFSTGSASGGYPVYPSAFPAARQLHIETPEEILALNARAKSFLSEVRRNARHKDTALLDEFVESLFTGQQLGLRYQSDANSTVAETITNRQANCLSLTLMTYALAKELGLDARLLDVEIPEYWSRREGFSLLNGHVNVQLSETRHFATTTRLVDFDARIQRQGFASTKMSLRTAIAMFYNNKAAFALVSKDYDLAFKYLNAALEQDGELTAAWVNLGVLYRFTQHNDFAEEAYRRAIAVAPEKLTAKENLAILYRLIGKQQEAERLAKNVRELRLANPYYHLIQGDEAFENGRFEFAYRHYRRAYRLDRDNHLVLFALSKAAMVNGNPGDAQGFLERAYRRADLPSDRKRYAAKLLALHQYKQE